MADGVLIGVYAYFLAAECNVILYAGFVYGVIWPSYEWYPADFTSSSCLVRAFFMAEAAFMRYFRICCYWN